MTAIAAQSNPRAEMQPMYLALLGRVNELVRGNVLPGLSTTRGVAGSFLAYVELWRLLRAALTPEASEVKPGQPHSVLDVLLGWFAPSPELLAELRTAENTAVRPLFPLRSGMRSGGVKLRLEDLPTLPPTDRELCEHVTRLGLPALADYLGSPSHAAHLVRLFAVLLQGEWEHAGIAVSVDWPRLPDPYAEDGPRLLLELLDEREPTGKMRRPSVATTLQPTAAVPVVTPIAAPSLTAPPAAAAPRATAPKLAALPPRGATSTAILSVVSARTAQPMAPPPAAASSAPPAAPEPAGGSHRASGPVPKAPEPEPEPALADDLRFTVYGPRTLKAEHWTPLLAFAHRSERGPNARASAPDPAEAVAAQAQAILGGERRSANRLSSHDADHRPTPFEARLEFVPDVAGVDFDPPTANCRPTGDVHRAEFRVRAQSDLAGQMACGALRVQFGGIVLAEIPLNLKVAGPTGMEHAGIVSESARMFRKIFISYSHEDWAIAEQARELARALGDDYLAEVAALREGERWSAPLQRLISEADVFQLFWSWNSLHAPFVRQEWEYALSLGRANFLRPTYWETPHPEPPAELRELNFRHLCPPSAARRPADGSAPLTAPEYTASTGQGSKPANGWTLLTVGGLAVSGAVAILLALSPGRGPNASPTRIALPPSAAAKPAANANAQPTPADPTDHPVEIQSRPAGAGVYLRGTRIGATPLEVTASADAVLEGLELRLGGHASKRVDLREAKDGVLDVELTPQPAQDPRAIAAELQRLRKELSASTQRYGQTDPRVRQLRARIETLKQLRATSEAAR